MKWYYVCLVVFSVFVISCTKDREYTDIQKVVSNPTEVTSRSRLPGPGNEVEIPIVLGRRRNNPYTLQNMTAAINKIYKTQYSTIPATHKYVRFMPSSHEHLALLEDWETDKLTAVFTYPLDYEVLIAGDYYIDPAVSDSIYTYRYTSVSVDVPMPDVPYEIIEELFIPPLSSYVAEQAFYQVGEPYEGDTSPHPDGPGDGDDPNDECTPGCQNYPCCKLWWVDCDDAPCGNDPFGPMPCMPGSPGWPSCLELFPPENPPGPGGPIEQAYCVCTEYTQGVAGNSWLVWIMFDQDCSDYEMNSNNYWVECNSHTPPPPPPVVLNECNCPIPSNPRYPAGCVKVQGDGFMNNEPVNQVMVILKDSWFTSDIVYTNTMGCWQHKESYYHNVWVTIKFKNDNCKIRAMRKARVLEAVGVADDYVDRFGAPPYNNIYVYYGNDVSDNSSRARRYWACAHTINGDSEYRSSASGDGIPLPRRGINYALFNANNSTGGAPMLQWRPYHSWPQLVIAFTIPFAWTLQGITSPLYPDITNNYQAGDDARLYKGTQFHELGHASHYSLVREAFWFPYRNHIVNNFLAGNGVYGSFGNFALGSDQDRVALGEAIGYFMGNRYGNTLLGGENFPFLDNFIPTGLMFDLIDVDVDMVVDPNNPSVFRLDIISGFTPAQFYGALTPGINSIRSFRNRLGTLSLGSTPNTLAEFNAFVDVYDVFN